MHSALTAVAMLLLVQATPPGPVSAPQPTVSVELPDPGTAPGDQVFRHWFIDEKKVRAESGGTLAPAAQRPEPAPSSPGVLCGMRVIQVDPAIDPKFVKTVPGEPDGMKIRRFVAPPCTR